ncbi:MAG: tetratricopeptide repeat protein [Dysgonamonadaceae bacterium]|jgi:TolA-binding protein|nr:tetratricopeptide repeat protein [Dysgonamonadaceae bacterium]
MKKIMFLFYCALCIQMTDAQRSTCFVSPDRLFREGQTMFVNKNYAGCIDKITAYKKQAKDPVLIQESDYLLAASAFHQGRSDAGSVLEDYLDIYPETLHRNEICFMIGSVYFQKNDYQSAEHWLKQSDIDLLSEPEQANLAYRMGIIHLYTDRDEEAFRLFSLLNRYSEKYKNTAEYYLAYLAYKKEDYDHALSLFNSLKNNPDFKPEVLYYITQIYFAKENYAQAIQEGLKLLNEYPENTYNPEMERIIGASYYCEENYTKAIQYLKSFIEKEKNVPENDYYMLGLSYYNLNNYAKATEYLGKSNPADNLMGQSIYLYLGRSFLKLEDKTNALRAFESASRMDFDASAKEAALYNYALLLHQSSVSGFGESVTVLENFVNTYPHSIYTEKVNDALVDVYLTTKNYDVALLSIAKIKNPGQKILEAKQKIYYYLGTVEFANSKYNQAIDYFTKAVASGNYAMNEKEQAIYWRGESYYRKNDYSHAANDYQAFLNTNNKNGNLTALANYNLGYCAIKQEQYSKAEAFFNVFISKEKNNKNAIADAYSRLGDCYFNNRQFHEAENAYNQAINTMPPASDYALFQKGYVMGLQKNYKGKITQMDELIRNFPQSLYLTDAIYEKGRTFVLLNNNTDAIETYQTLLNKYPNSNQARKAGLQIGLLYYNSNQPQQAATAYKQVIARYPESEEAKVALQDLKSVYFDMNNVNGYAEYIASLGGSVKFEISEQDSLTFLAAERFFLKKDIKQAQNALNNYLQSFPRGAFTTNAHYYLANIYYNQKEYATAKKEYAKVLEAGNTQFTEEAIGRTAELQYNDKEYEAALQCYEQLQNTAESKSNRETGSLGMIRSAAQLKNYNVILHAATVLLKDETLNPETATEARYYRAKACLSLNEKAKAEADLEDLARDTRTAYGAEAKYLLAQYYFDTNHAIEAKIVIQDYIQQGTPYPYWLAKSFILLSDIYAAENDKLQARQYLESLQVNYKNTNDDIHKNIKERLAKLK